MALSDVLMAWKHLLQHKLCLPHAGPARPENHDLILETYTSFLARSNTVDVLNVLSMYAQLRPMDCDPVERIDPVRIKKKKKRLVVVMARDDQIDFIGLKTCLFSVL